MNLTTELWSEIASHLGYGDAVYNPTDDAAWFLLRSRDGDTLTRTPEARHHVELWRPKGEEKVRIEVPPVEEPPDGSRIEFAYGSDLYGAWRDDEDSVKTGWRADQGWCLYGESVPCSWAVMWLRFGESLRGAVRLEVVR